MKDRFFRKRLWASLLFTAAAASVTVFSTSPAARNPTRPPRADGKLPAPGAFAGVRRDSLPDTPAGQAGDVERVINNTRALQAVSMTDAGVSGDGRRELRVVVKNVSDKEVVEYIFLRADDSTLRTSGATTGWGLLPGATDAVTVRLAEGEVLTLSAALFEDGTGEGDARQLARIRDYRLGVREQYKRAEPILRHAMNDPVLVRTPATLEGLQSQLSALPAPSPGSGLSPERAAGLHDAKRFIELQLGAEQQGHGGGDDPLPEVVHLKAEGLLKQIEKALARFQRSDLASDPRDERR